MKRMLASLLMICSGMGLTGLILIPESQEVVTPLILQTFTVSRNVTDAIAPYTTEQLTETVIMESQGTVTVRPEVIPSGGISWLISKTSDGSPKQRVDVYELTYDRYGNLLSKVHLEEASRIIEAEPVTYSYGSKLVAGAYFTSRKATSYGADCYGCGGEESGYSGTSAGIQLSTTAVRQSNGDWEDGITYDGYYLIAADKSLPLCTVVEVSNHRWSGEGLVSGETFLALVVDRGGAITESDIDLFTGSEAQSRVRNGSQKNVKITIVGFGRLTRNSLGQRMCKVN